MNRKHLNIGLLGFGSMGRTHTWAISAIPFYYKNPPFEARLAGVYTRTERTREDAKSEFGFAKAYSSEDELIADPDIDIIDITTPNIAHYETIKKAINAGKHIYCEKPLTTTAEEADEVARLSSDAGITAQIVFNTRFLSPIMRAKQLIDEGRLGRIISFRSSYLHASCTDLVKSAGWKQDKTVCGGGVLFDLGSHALDLVYYLCGNYKKVWGMSQIAHPTRLGMDGKPWQTNADEAFYMLCELECGAKGTVEANKLAVGANDDFKLEIYGERGALRFDLMEPNWLWFYDMNDKGGDLGGERGFKRIECCGRYPEPAGIFPGVKAPIGWLRGHLGSMYSFLSAVAGEKQVGPNFNDAAHIQRVMQAAYESDMTGAPVVIS